MSRTSVTHGPFAGHVFVVAGSAPVFSAVADALTLAGAAVAMVGPATAAAPLAAHFRADPADVDVWARVLPHVEQRLGPIDAVVTAEESHAIAERLVGPDLLRRGHGDVIVVTADAEVGAVLTRLAGTL